MWYVRGYQFEKQFTREYPKRSDYTSFTANHTTTFFTNSISFVICFLSEEKYLSRNQRNMICYSCKWYFNVFGGLIHRFILISEYFYPLSNSNKSLCNIYINSWLASHWGFFPHHVILKVPSSISMALPTTFMLDSSIHTLCSEIFSSQTTWNSVLHTGC